MAKDRKDLILDRLDEDPRAFCESLGVKFPQQGKDIGLCPLHDDRNPSFSLFRGEEDGHWRFKCHGCGKHGNLIDLYMEARKLVFRDAVQLLGEHFGIEKPGRLPVRTMPATPTTLPTAEWVYTDEQGAPLFRVCRYDSQQGKRFVQGGTDGNGGWRVGSGAMAGVRRVLYRLPEIVAAGSVVLVEGEKCADVAREKLGLVATTAPGGAKGWRPEYAESLRGKRVLIIPDNDRPGEEYMADAARSLVGVAADVRVLHLPDLGPKEDIADWVARGGTRDAFVELFAAKARPWTAPPKENASCVPATAMDDDRPPLPDHPPGPSISIQVDDLAGPDDLEPDPDAPVAIRERIKRRTAAYDAKIVDLIPETGFLPQYIHWGCGLTDAADVLHIGAAYAVAGTVIARNVWLNPWGQYVFPNFYVVLIGPSTTSRKSTVITLARKIIEKATPERLWPSEFSYEGLLEVIKDQPQGTLLYSELAQLLSLFGRNYSEGAKAFLIDLFDSPDRFARRLRKENIEIEQPCATILAGSAETWLEQTLGATGMQGGFLARLLLFIVGREDKRRWMAFGPQPDPWAVEDLANTIKAAGEVKGPATLSGDALDAWEAWTKKHEDNIDRMVHQETVASAIGRLNVYALKIAMVNAVTSRGSKEVSGDDMERALRLTDLCRQNVVRFSSELSPTKEGGTLKRVLSLIQERPGISRRDLVRHARIPVRDLGQYLLTLIEGAEVVAEQGRQKNQFTYWPAGNGHGGGAE